MMKVWHHEQSILLDKTLLSLLLRNVSLCGDFFTNFGRYYRTKLANFRAQILYIFVQTRKN